MLYIKGFNRVWHTSLPHKLKSCGVSSQISGLVLSVLSNRWLQVFLGGKLRQDYPVYAGVPRCSILGLSLLLFINYLPGDVICNIAIYADVTTLYSNCDETFDLWQQLELAS